MESGSKKSEAYPQLLNLIPNSKEWLMMSHNNGGGGGDNQRIIRHESTSPEEKKLELRLAPPGPENWSTQNRENDRQKSLLSLGYFSNGSDGNSGSRRFPFGHHQFSSKTTQLSHNPQTKTATTTANTMPVVMGKESSQHCSASKKGVVEMQSSAEKKVLLPSSSVPPPVPAAKTTAVPNGSQKRTAPAPVVGWPPIRSFRKNLANTSSSSKQAAAQTQQNGVVPKLKKPVDESTKKGNFVKINMDGVPIGRKVDLKAYDSYEKLATAVDQLFRGLLAAQRDSIDDEMVNNQEGEKPITGVLDGSGEYTLIYEDNEGDKLLVGDVPWHMFVSTVKRLRVLKSSDVSSLNLGSSKQDKILA